MQLIIDFEIKKYQPFIKWVGGKRALLNEIFKYIPNNFNNYYEPFLGGGALFFELYSKGVLDNRKIYLSDINKELINSYMIIKDSPKELIKNLELFKKKHNKEFFYKIREQDREQNFFKIDPVLRASRFIYLNKTCFNGLYRVNKKGYFNTPIGSYKNPNIADKERILNANEALKYATLENKSFHSLDLNNINKDDFVYFDPPYYPLNETSSFTSYNGNIFLEKEQKELFELFNKLNEKEAFLLKSNSNAEFISNLYKDYEQITIQANRTINSKANGRGKINEVLIRNKK